MKLAILGTRGIPARYGGFETFAEEIAIRLVEAGHEVTVYCELHPDTEELPTYKGVDLVYIKTPKLGPLSTIWFDLKCLVHARSNFDIVYMLGYGASVFCFIPRLWGTPVWVNMDGIEWARTKYNLLGKTWCLMMETFSMFTASRMICDAEAIYHHINRRQPFTPAHSVIEYGAPIIDDDLQTDVLEHYGVKAREYYLVVCRMEPENHVLEILEGFAASDAKYPLIVLGNIDMETDYVEKLKQVNDPKVRLVGTMYDQKKLQHLRRESLAYFHGHSVGGTNPSLIEALGCGNVVVAHDNEFNREVAGEKAFYFEKQEQIPAIVDKVENDQTLDLESYRQAARNRIKERYTWEIITKKYIDLINVYKK